MLRKFPCVLLARRSIFGLRAHRAASTYPVRNTTQKLKSRPWKATPRPTESLETFDAENEDPFFDIGQAGAEADQGAKKEEHELIVDKDLEPLPDFAVLGVRKSVRVALHESFPSIRTATACQTEFIPAVLRRKDILLKDRTGTGKTLGLILALLSKERATRPRMTHKERTVLAKRPITSLVIVPHRDLAFQLMQWIRQLCPHNRESSIDSIAQVCVRGIPTSPLQLQIEKLRDQAPHILIGTPQALLEILEADKKVLQLATLETVVVDEADYLLPAPCPDATKKELRNWERHPPPTLTLLNAIFAGRSKLNREANPTPWRWSLQSILLSATLRRCLRLFLFGKTDWMNRYSETVKLNFLHEPINEGVAHYALVVDDSGRVNNSDCMMDWGNEERESDSHKNSRKVPKDADKPERAARLVSPHVLEAIATTFALDVPRIALLVLPATGAVKSIVQELQELGIDARSLALQDEDRGRPELIRRAPSLLVTTLASIRGLDFPELTHVFIAGVAENASEYAHAAGRVGRFGREGKVMSFLERKDEEKAGAVYRQLDISLSEFSVVKG
ncbi:P-loop containing nucleoside triphosphate hydrolase protein [Hysterangium stoloniferum]|nr:P-loop containing nucleoside triphosphate hydrolase protein [Hysterangium stoloniferum]